MFEVGECMPTVPGAIGAFRRDTSLDVGGVPAVTLAEDTDLTMAILRAAMAGDDEESAIAWTEASLRRCGSYGDSVTAGVTAPCRPCGDTAGPRSNQDRPGN